MHIKTGFVLLVVFTRVQLLYAQPYLDVAAAKFQFSPDAGVVRRNQAANHFTYSNAGLNLPHVFKDSSVLVLGPGLEKWDLKSNALQGMPPVLKGLSVQLAFIKPLARNWTATFLVLPRWNGGKRYSFNNKMLPAGAVLASRKTSDAFTYKFGLYYHNEYYGHIFIPLFGLDWKINPTLVLFGILPGSLTLEKKVNRAFYYGAAFRALTASYAYGDSKNFIRIDENQVQAFADFYLAKHVVLNAEIGHSVLRRFRTGRINGATKYELTNKFNDNLLLRIGLAYRMRFE